MIHNEKNYCPAMMTIPAPQTEDKEGEAMGYVRSKEFACVGAGNVGGFQNIKELHVMKYKEAMANNDTDDLEVAVEEEQKEMEKYDVWTQQKLQDFLPGAKIITSTRDTKKKANITYQARIITRGYEKVEGMQYDTAKIASPVTNLMSIHIAMVLTLMDGREGRILTW